ETRYVKMAKLGVRGVEAFNERIIRTKQKREVLKRSVQTGFDRETGKPVYEDEVLELEPTPYIVVVVDEVADLMLVSGKEIDAVTEEMDDDAEDGFGSEMGGEGSEDLFDQAVQIVARERKVSISYIQRRLQIGYNRAAGLIERMEDDGMISKPNHQGKREILLPEH